MPATTACSAAIVQAMLRKMGAGRPKGSAQLAIELTLLQTEVPTTATTSAGDDGRASKAGSEKLFPRVSIRRLEAFEIDHVTLHGGEPLPAATSSRSSDAREPARGRPSHHRMAADRGSIADRLAPYRCVMRRLTLQRSRPRAPRLKSPPEAFRKTLSGFRALPSHRVRSWLHRTTKQKLWKTRDTLELFRSIGVVAISLSRVTPPATLRGTQRSSCRGCASSSPPSTGGAVCARAGHALACTMPMPPCAVESTLSFHQFGTCPIGTRLHIRAGPDGKLRMCTLHRTALGGVSECSHPTLDCEAARPRRGRRYRARHFRFCQGLPPRTPCCGARRSGRVGARDARKKPTLRDAARGRRLAARLERERRDGSTHL